jgi:hypothetical protein
MLDFFHTLKALLSRLHVIVVRHLLCFQRVVVQEVVDRRLLALGLVPWEVQSNSSGQHVKDAMR